MKKFLAFAAIGALAFAAGCSDDDTVEVDMDDGMEEMADDVGDAMEEAGEDMEDAADDMEDAADDM